MRFLEIILSMSICGVMFISLNYTLELDMNMTSEGFKSQFMNGDFMIDEFVTDTTMTGISSKSYKKLSKISGVENIESSMVMPSRMVIDKNDISNKEYFKNINDSSKDMYFKSLLDKDKKTKEIILKNNIKGYNDNALKKMNDYLLSGDVNLKDLKEKDLAILYIPQIVGDNPFPQFNKNGKNVLDIKVGDKIKVKFRKDRDVSSDDYWTMNDKGDYEYKTFEVGAISYYPYMNETSVIGYSTVEVIISEENFRKIMGIDAYTSLNVNLKKCVDDRKIEGEILDIVSKDKDVITRNIVKEKENIKAIHKKRKIYNLGISLIVLLIAIINIVNNIKYNIITRKKEYGILRAVALDRINLEKMIAFEGILYGILSSVLSVIVAFFMQKIIYELSGVRNIGIEFSINYLNYITIIILNIILGFFTTYIQSKKISKLNIIECIKKDE